MVQTLLTGDSRHAAMADEPCRQDLRGRDELSVSCYSVSQFPQCPRSVISVIVPSMARRGPRDGVI